MRPGGRGKRSRKRARGSAASGASDPASLVSMVALIGSVDTLLPSPVHLPHCRIPNANDLCAHAPKRSGARPGHWGVNVLTHGGNTKRAGELLPGPPETGPN